LFVAATCLLAGGCISVDVTRESRTSSSPSTREQPKAATPAAPSAEARLVELGIKLPEANKPSATLTPIVIVGNFAFVSGHTSRAADGKSITGRVGEELTVAQGKDAARQVGLSVLATLKNELGSLDRVKRVVKVLGMVNCPAGFKEQPQVINGFSELLIDVFGKERGLGARSAVGMSSLPGNVAVEIEGVFEIER
jgi:enamine deaminase RidA (YjgF/YER057c/UK114 family)